MALTKDEKETMFALMESLIREIGYFTYGGVTSPRGLEALTMSICGHGDFDKNLSASIFETGYGISGSLNKVADGLDNIAEALRELKNK